MFEKAGYRFWIYSINIPEGFRQYRAPDRALPKGDAATATIIFDQASVPDVPDFTDLQEAFDLA